MNSHIKMRTAILISMFLVAVASMVVLELKARVQTAESFTSKIADAFQGLERAIGYGGLIHHFKNAVLRPDEPSYIDLANESYATAVSEIEQIKDLLHQAVIEIDVSEFRNTIDEYGKEIANVRAAHQRGTPIAEIDRLVRIDDNTAKAILTRLHQEIKDLLEKRERTAAQLLSIGLVTFLLLICFLMLAVFYLVWFRQRHLQLAHDQQSKELEQKKAHAEETEKLLAQLEKANKEQAEFTYAVSHDLKSPSNTIGMLIAELSEIETLTPDGRNVLSDMTDTNQRMIKLVDNVLEYSKMVDKTITFETVDLNDLIKQC